MLEFVSWIAAVVAILAFLGYSADFTVKVILGASLSIIAMTAGLANLIPSIRKWLSPSGAFEDPKTHVRRILRALAALALAVFVVIAVIQAAAVHP